LFSLFDKLPIVKPIQISAEQIILSLLKVSESEQVCILDSGGVSYLDSHLLIAGLKPIKTLEINEKEPLETLKQFEQYLISPNKAFIFTISYDFGLKLEKIPNRKKEFQTFPEPDIFLQIFECLIIHNYKTGKTFLQGNEKGFDEIENMLLRPRLIIENKNLERSNIKSNFTKKSYFSAIEKIQEYIRCGDTYQTNLTQQFRAQLPASLTAQKIFWTLRNSHPASFSSFIKRKDDFVVSISPERFFKVKSKKDKCISRIITTSPIKGTRPRGKNPKEDLRLKNELLNSEKDRAENVMIVDLLRNDIGRICEFGSVWVEKLCKLETHPTLFHLVSTINGELKQNIKPADIIKAVFPCGSISGAPKIRTMEIIDEIETVNRGVSMGAIGYSFSGGNFQLPNLLDLNVAIRTMVIRKNEAIFNVGGGIVIDSVAEDEYQESILKAKALFKAINGEFIP
jgi:para-aminobenzoate synthetase component 1